MDLIEICDKGQQQQQPQLGQRKQMVVLDLTSASDSEELQDAETSLDLNRNDVLDMECHDVEQQSPPPAISTASTSCAQETPACSESTNSAPVRVSPIKRYALRKDVLPPKMITFLDELRSYFLQSVNLERQKGPITHSTMDKAEERILCKYNFELFTI